MQNANVFVYNGGPIPEDIDRESITHVHVKEGVTSIPDDAFKKWSCLKSVFITDGVTSIGDGVFNYCGNLISIRLPDSLETIGATTFRNCNELVNIRLPPNITHMGSYSFCACLSLSHIDIPSSMTYIASYTFSLCKALSKATIPTSVSTIGYCSFDSCRSIISIKLHSAIQHIDKFAFASCTSLLSIQIPPSTTKIENCAFSSCTSLMIAYFPSTAIEDSKKVFGSVYRSRSNDYYSPNLILLTDRDDFIYHDDDRGDTPSLTLRAIQQFIHGLPNNNNNDATTDNNDNANGDIPIPALPDIAQRAQQSGLNLLHLLVYFPGDILQPLTMLLDKCPLVTTAVDNTGRTPFHHTITSTQQNMDSASYDLLVSRTPNEVLHLAIQSGAPWHEVHDILKAKVNGLDAVDKESGLMPFMMVAITYEEEYGGSDVALGLTAIYELLCMKPDVMNEYVDVERTTTCSGTGNLNMETCAGDNGAEIMMKRRRLE